MKKEKCEVIVVGAGPGGYAAAFYAADLGKKVVLVELAELGGVCLNRGCIPSKALLNAVKVISDAKKSDIRGISFDKPKLDLNQLRAWKQGIVKKLSSGIEGLAKKRNVQVVQGKGYFEGDNLLRVETKKGQIFFEYEKAIIATGSRPALPSVFDLGNPRIMTSTEALNIEDIPAKLLVVGGGYIGMELGTVYAGLGSEVHVVEAMSQILTGADRDLVRPIVKYAESHFKSIKYDAKVVKMATKGKQINVTIEHDKKKKDELYDRVLISVGRSPNSGDIGLENTGVKLDEKGYIKINNRQETDDKNIYAIGDIAGGLMLAHKASKEARIAVENIMGDNSEFRDFVIPAVVFTDPELAWVGLTEDEAKKAGRKVKIAKFPWAASGRALTLDKSEGVTKLIIDPATDRVLGVGIVGPSAGDLISEAALAIEMGATAKDLALTIHPHPTLSETVMEAAEVYYGHCTHS